MKSPSKTTLEKFIKSKGKKIDAFRKSDKGLAFSHFQKGQTIETRF